jgi:hypothetical protein
MVKSSPFKDELTSVSCLKVSSCDFVKQGWQGSARQ